MNKEYALEIIDMVERHTLERTSPLFKEAVRYLERLKSTAKDSDLLTRIHRIKTK